jgi:single-stranded-DNA-specific exonuclease
MQTFESSIFEQTVWVDATLNAEDIQLSNALALEFLLPWGQGIPQPLFVGEFYLDSLRVLSSKHVKAQLKLGKQGVNIDAICFGADIEKWQLIDNSATKMVHAVYSMTVNRFRGDQSLQLVIDFIH